MEIQRPKGNLILNPGVMPREGVLVLYCDWSGEAIMILKHIIEIMKGYPDIDLYVLDIDKPEYKFFEKEYNFFSHCVGETYWISNYEITHKILNYRTDGENVNAYMEMLSAANRKQ